MILVGCGSWDAIPENLRTLDDITLTIPEWFSEIPSKLVENRQITNQILYAGKKDLTEDDIEDNISYTLNLIVTQSVIATWITYDQFAQVNTDKMQQYMIGYSRESNELLSFECWAVESQWIHTIFTIEDDYYQPGWIYRFHHYQFVHNAKGYIISLAWLPDQTRTLKKTFQSITDSLGCR
jgi:hypothetical protein